MDDKLNQDEIEALLAGLDNNVESESEEVLTLSDDEIESLLSDIGTGDAEAFQGVTASGDSKVDDAEDFDFINDISVFDTVERTDPLEEAIKNAQDLFEDELENGEIFVDNVSLNQEEPEQTPQKSPETSGKKSSPFSVPVIIGVLLLLIVSSLGIGFRIINIISESIKPENQVLAEAERITQSNISTNSANFTYLKTEPVAFGSDIIEVVKISFDSQSTIVCFRNTVDWSKFEVNLMDENGKFYTLSPEGEYGVASDRLVFSPINSKVRGLVLTIFSPETGEETTFPFMFNQNIKIAPVAYINSAKSLVNNDFASIRLLNASFSSSASSLTYALTWNDDREVLVDNITLTSGTRQVFPKENGITKIKGSENTEIYNVKFGPLNSFKDQVNLNFNGVYFKYNLGLIIDSAPLFKDTEETQKRISVDSNTIVLERMGAMGPYFVLVAHCEDENGKRTYADYDVSFELYDSKGNKYTLEGRVKTDTVGTDMIFDVRNLGDFEKAANFRAGNITIDSCQIKTENISVSIDLSGHEYSMTTKSTLAISMAEEFLIQEGAVSCELITYFWDGSIFNAYYKVYENGELKRYLITSMGEQNNMGFKKVLFM